MLTQNEIERILDCLKETREMIKSEEKYLPELRDNAEITRLRSHEKSLLSVIEDNAFKTYALE